MAWTADWDGDFLIGGANRLRLTPNFRLNEFQDEAGKVRAHRELIATLQLLRDRYGKSISVGSTDDDGLGATIISKQDSAGLLEASQTLKQLNFFEVAEPAENGAHVRIADPSTTVEVDLEQALMTAFSVTAAFETVGNPFQQITGNFDGAGISFGPSQWNFKSKTLEPLFSRFKKENPDALKACFMNEDDDQDYAEFLDVLKRPVAEQIAWGNDISTGSNRGLVVEPWRTYFRNVGDVELFRSIMVEESLRKYGARALNEIKYLQSLAPGVQIDHLRAFCAIYDLVIQQGSLHRAKKQIEERVKDEQPTDQMQLIGIAVEERGRKANSPWRADAISRRKGVLAGVPVHVEVTRKEKSQRANINFYMLRNVHIRGAKELMNSDVTQQLHEVSVAIAQGKSLTAV